MEIVRHILGKGSVLTGVTCVAVLSIASCGGSDDSGGGSGGSSGGGGSGNVSAGGSGNVSAGGSGNVPAGGTGNVGTGGGGNAGGAPPMGPPCCGGIGQCVDQAKVPPNVATNLAQDVCDQGLLCAPSTFGDPSFIPKKCTSASMAEGRCVNQCFTAGVGAAQFLPQDVCQAGEICVPCYNQVDGSSTGACEQNGDMPTQPPVTFPDCCTNRGKCVPFDLVPPDRQDDLKQDTCAMGNLCAPTVSILDPMYHFPACTANILFQQHPGACVYDCLVDASQKGLLAQETCQPMELCAPCINPLDMMPTGACD